MIRYRNFILDKWFITSDDGVDNCCIEVAGYSKPMRGRSSMIVLRRFEDGIYVCAKQNDKDDYGVPGGGWNIDEKPKDAAIRELHEEVGIDVENVFPMGTLIEYDENDAKEWVKEHVEDPKDWWYGYYSKIFVGTYAGEWDGYVDEADKETGYRWISIDDAELTFPEEYFDAIQAYMREFM